MRSAARSIILFSLSFLLCQQMGMCARFVDTGGHWSERYINKLSDQGVILAAPDGKFAPDKPVSRADFVVWLVKVLRLDDQTPPAAPSYADVGVSDPEFKAVEIARRNNIMSGFADGFRPQANISRAEVMALLARLLAQPLPDAVTINAELSKFKDGDKVPEWARAAVAQDVCAGVFVDEAQPQSLRPQADAARGEIAAMFSRLDDFLGKQQIDAALATPVAPLPQGQPFSPNYNSAPGAPPASVQTAANGVPFLQGGVALVAAGTKFRAQLRTTLDSATARPGDQVEAVINDPVFVNGSPVIPAGTRLIGTVADAVSARRFRAGANGRIELKFTSLRTPDGRMFPLAASVDGIRMSGGSTAGRVGKGVATTAIGAGGGALLGTAIGAIVGGSGGGRSMGQAVGMGAIMGTAIGGGVGAVGAVVRKGSEVRFNSGMSLPLQLDSTLQMTGVLPQSYPQSAPY